MKLSSTMHIYKDKYVLHIFTRVVPKVMPPTCFHGNYNRHRDHNKIVGNSKFSASKHYFCMHP